MRDGRLQQVEKEIQSTKAAVVSSDRSFYVRLCQEMFRRALGPVSVQVAMTVSDGQFQQARPLWHVQLRENDLKMLKHV